MAEENEQTQVDLTEEDPAEQVSSVEPDARPGWRDIFRQAFEKARRDRPPANRSGLGRDRSRSLFLLAGAAIAVLLLFLGVFSSPNHSRKVANARPAGTPDLGQRATPGQQESGPTGSVAPLLSAQTAQETPGSQGVTAEDIDKTAHPVRAPRVASRAAAGPTPGKAGPYALGRIDFADVAAGQPAPGAVSPAKSDSDDLRKPSLIFVRNVPNSPAGSGARTTAADGDDFPTLALPSGTKLMARLESVVTSAVKEPIVAAIEYNYERDGEIVVPAGAKALGSLQQASRSGNVGIRFDAIQQPDGTTERIEATAMSLAYGPLKGTVSGKKTATNFLLRTFTGLGEAATYLVGSGGLSAPLSESAFLRDRIATNIGIAGDQELNNLTFNQDIVVTVPANTRFYIVMEHGAAPSAGPGPRATTSQTGSASIPSMEELRQLLQLREEMSALYQQEGATQSAAQRAPQQ